jgi:heptosyltransferase-3
MSNPHAAASRVLTYAHAPARILVVVTRRIGDVLLATPVVRSLKRAWPQSALDVLVFAGTEGLIAGNRDVRQVLTIPERPGVFAHLAFLASLARRYDLALSLVPGDRPTLYAWAAGRRRVGLLEDTSKARWKRRLLDAWVPFDNDDTHTVRMHLALLNAIGIAPISQVNPAWTAADEAQAREALLPLGGARFAVLHPYPKFRYKMWTEHGWSAVASWLKQRGWRVVLTGGPDREEREYVARIASSSHGALDLSGRLSLGAVACVISRAALYVGPDTAITHAAAALGIPTVAVFGPTNPVKWGPWPAGEDGSSNPWRRVGSQAVRRVRLVQGAGDCVPCGQEGCERHVASWSDCLTSLSAQTVIEAIQGLLGEEHST